MVCLAARRRGLRGRLITAGRAVAGRPGCVPQTGSTNADLLEGPGPGRPKGWSWWPRSRPPGGRLGRAWSAPPRAGAGLFRAAPAGGRAARPARLAAAADRGGGGQPRCAEAAVPASLKWPNDVLVGGAEDCAGILAEATATRWWSGSGSTSRSSQARAAGADRDLAAAWRMRPGPRAALLAAILTGPRRPVPGVAARTRMRRSLRGGVPALVRDTIGRPVQAELPAARVRTGTAEDVDDAGPAGAAGPPLAWSRWAPGMWCTVR